MRQRWMIGMAALIAGLVVTAGAIPARAAVIAPPAGLATTIAVGAATDTATLTWTASGTIKSFTIQRASFKTGVNSITIPGTATSYAWPGIAKGEVYKFRIKANTSAGSSKYSPPVEAAAP